MLQALYYGLQYNSQNIQFIMNKLREYGSNIHTNTFGAGFSMSKGVLYYCTPPFSGRPLKEVVDEQYLPPINNIDNDIRNLENFSSIVHDYNSLMKQLHERIDICTTRNFPSGINELEETFN